MKITLSRMIETPAQTEKVERIEGLEEAVIKFEYDFSNVTEHEFEALQKAARAYLKMQGGK